MHREKDVHSVWYIKIFQWAMSIKILFSDKIMDEGKATSSDSLKSW